MKEIFSLNIDKVAGFCFKRNDRCLCTSGKSLY